MFFMEVSHRKRRSYTVEYSGMFFILLPKADYSVQFGGIPARLYFCA